MEQFERRSVQSPGDFVMYMSDTPYPLDFPEPIDELVVHVPMRSLSTPTAQLRELCARTFVADSAVRATTAYADALLDADDDTPVDHLANTVSYLLDSALCGYLSISMTDAPDDVLRTRAERYIDLNASDNALSPMPSPTH